ncbi:ParB/RepB/Spo0J family partition protein, partial [Rhizobium leguminosarum]|uniref:ParB/RepB/Spo0J family partition protein n=1 Tax=Rhizobium leguminosarum TaxID=384 RepID=UPI001DA823A6|nr:plasmid partitioning protein RepB [Rhizobium leguminosarum]
MTVVTTPNRRAVPSVDETIGEQADFLSSYLQPMSEALFPSTSQKFLRKFMSVEAPWLIGEAVISIETVSIHRAEIVDRIAIHADPAFDALVASIAEHGQQIPILVRPNTQASERLKIAYGRHRAKAAENLGCSVRAIIPNLSDSKLDIDKAGGNHDRKDPSFLEKACFAKNLEDGGCERPTIIAALASDKADVSRYVAIARQVPYGLVKLIGPAPESRARALDVAFQMPLLTKQTAYKLLAGFADKLESDARLDALLRALSERSKKSRAK